jgi:hypothetical protein
MPWTAKSDDGCNYSFNASVRDAAGYTAAFDVHVLSVGPRSWSYHLAFHAIRPLANSAPSGTLEFDDAGHLAQHRPTVPLRFPEPDGALGPEIALDFETVALTREYDDLLGFTRALQRPRRSIAGTARLV